MDDKQAVRFVNEVVRPLAEDLRAMRVRLGALRTTWFSGMNSKFAEAGEPVVDGRENEGVSRLTCGDVTNFVAQALKTAPGEAGEWNDQIVEKPCVRSLEVR
jgi:hypothetical protein